MSHLVRLLPTGASFQVEEQESLLEGALRSGVAVPYNCNSGTCGACKARLIEGGLGPSRFHDYRFSEAERIEGILLLCSATAASDLSLELVDAAAEIPHQQIEARIAHLQQPTPHHLLLQLRTPRTRTLRFRAGQSVTLTLPEGLQRSLPVASCPCNGMILEFHLERLAGDPFVAALEKGARSVQITGPEGQVGLDEHSSRPLLFLAEGSGLAVVKSLIEHTLALELPQPITLVWLTPPDARYLDNWCRALVDALDDFTYLPLDPGVGSLQLVQLPTLVPQLANSDLYLAASESVAAAVSAAALQAGLPAGRLFTLPLAISRP